MKTLVTLAALTILFLAAAQAKATYKLEIFNNDTLAANPNLLFTVDVLANGSDKVDFVIKNESTMNSSVKIVFFDSDLISGISGILNGPGTEFEADFNPGNLPAGNTIGFDTNFSVSALPPPPTSGINPTEQITITCNLNGSFSDLIGQIDSGASRVGVHIISIPNLNPDCDENTVSVSAVTPEPATIALLGLGAISLLRKRSSK